MRQPRKSRRAEEPIPIESFFVDYYETVLSAGEILTEIVIPNLAAKSAGSYATLDQVTNSIAIASTPLKVEKAKDILVGKKINEAEIERVAQEARALCNPTGNAYASAEYRKEMIHVLTRRALQDALKKIGA